MNLAELKRFAPAGKLSILQGIADAWEDVIDADIATPGRICHFLAQVAHESDGFRTATEYASGEAYEGRKDLGNDVPGDGKKYRGRGLIQITGRANARAFYAWCMERYGDVPDFVAKPEKLATMPWAIRGAIWYWSTRKLSRLADKNDIRGITKAINGGYNGLEDRRNWFRKAVTIWGDGAVNPNGSSFLGTRAVKAALTGGSGILGFGSLSAISDQSDGVTRLVGNASDVAGHFGISTTALVLGGVCVGLAGLVAYLLKDRLFIYRHEGL